MEKDRIDSELRSKLLGHETPIDVDKVWSGIDQRQDGRKRRGWIYISLGIGFLMLIAGSFFLNNNLDSSILEKEQIAQIELAKEVITNNESQLKPSEELRSIEVSKEPKIVTESSTKENQKSKIVSESPLKRNSLLSSNQKSDLPISAKRSSSNTVNLYQRIKPHDLVGAISQEVMTDRSVNEEEVTTIKTNAPKTDRFLNTTSNSKGITESSSRSIVMQVPVLLTEIISLKTKNVLYPQLMVMKVEKEEAEEKENRNLTGPKSKWIFEGALYSNVFYHTKNVSADPALADYVNEKMASETPLEALALGVNINAISSCGFLVYSGIQGLQMTEKFRFTKTLNQTSEANFQSRVVVRDIDKKIYNQIRLIEIPLGIGYSKSSNKWDYSIRGGIDFNLALNASGQLLNQELLPDEIANIELYKNSVGLSYTGLLSINYSLTENLGFGLGAKYKHYQSSFTSAESGIEEYHKLLGLQLSMNYKF